MGRILVLVIVTAAVFSLLSTVVAEDATQISKVIKLDQPDLNKGVSIMQALSKRQTIRDISDKALTKQQL